MEDVSVFSLYAMPNHLRPSTSYRALSIGNFETPKNFKDRLYLTDVVDSFRKVLEEHNDDFNMKVIWHKGYFPWKIKIRLYGGTLLLMGKLYGESSWASAITMQFKDLDNVLDKKIAPLMKKFVSELGRLPYESPYWVDDTWERFCKEHKTTRRTVAEKWAKYL